MIRYNPIPLILTPPSKPMFSWEFPRDSDHLGGVEGGWDYSYYRCSYPTFLHSSCVQAKVSSPWRLH